MGACIASPEIAGGFDCQGVPFDPGYILQITGHSFTNAQHIAGTLPLPGSGMTLAGLNMAAGGGVDPLRKIAV
jgi:hypothetical protein